MSKDKIDLIYDLLKAEKEESVNFRKEVRESHNQTDKRLSKLETQGEVQNQQLAEHMRRTEVLEDLHMSNEAKIAFNSDRINKLEEPRKALYLLNKWFLGVGAIAGAIVAIAKFTGLF